MACFGTNLHGELGTGTSTPGSITPLVVPLPSPVTAIGSAPNQSCAVLNTGSVFCWGGDPDDAGVTRPPTDKLDNPMASAVAAGVDFACTVPANMGDLPPVKGVECFGDNLSYQLGSGG